MKEYTVYVYNSKEGKTYTYQLMALNSNQARSQIKAKIFIDTDWDESEYEIIKIYEKRITQ